MRRNSVADMTSLVFFTTMGVEFIERIKGLVTEFAFGVAGETSEGDVFDGVAGCEVRGEFAGCVEDMFVCENFFVLCTERTGS
jgi:hypothetical protein